MLNVTNFLMQMAPSFQLRASQCLRGRFQIHGRGQNNDAEESVVAKNACCRAGAYDETILPLPMKTHESHRSRSWLDIVVAAQKNVSFEEPPPMATRPQTTSIKQGKILVFLLLSWAVFIFYVGLPGGGYRTGLSAESAPAPAKLHFLVPASKQDPNLCKLLVSAAVAGYPAPVLINWGKAFDDAQYVEGGSHLAKIAGAHDYLSKLGEDEDDSLVLMVDGFDVWMQLRPQTLIDRYFETNRRANKRIAGVLGATATKHDVRQEIIFGCQKRCWPWTEKDPPCYAAPHSTLPKDIYGPQTDTDIGNEANPYIKYRQRFLNSGVAIGTVRSMRRLFKQALILLETEKNIGSDQWIFAHIFGDQEIWREALRRDSSWRSTKLGEKFRGKPETAFNPEHIEEVRAKAAAREEKNFEFGIGLDYEGAIGLNTVFAEDDTEWLTWSDREQVEQAENRLGIPHAKSRMSELAADVSRTLPPFWTSSNETLPGQTQWSEVSLLTNIWTGTVPVVIHHNAHRDGAKARRETWWDQIWFAKYVRTLYDVNINEPISSLAHSGYDAEMQRAWWPAERWKGGGRDGSSAWNPQRPGGSMEEGWVRFENICRDYHEEVFRDGKGPWQLPIHRKPG